MKLYTTKEIAEILQLSLYTITRYIREGKLETVKVGSQYRITEEQLEKFLKSGE
jgi:excisionase family DNA binding protein